MFLFTSLLFGQGSLLGDESLKTVQRRLESACECCGAFMTTASKQEQKLVNRFMKFRLWQVPVMLIKALQNF